MIGGVVAACAVSVGSVFLLRSDRGQRRSPRTRTALSVVGVVVGLAAMLGVLVAVWHLTSQITS